MFHILNKQYTKEEYEKIVASFEDKNIFDSYYQKYIQLVSDQPLDNSNVNSSDCI
jgi:hypothetical protein